MPTYQPRWGFSPKLFDALLGHPPGTTATMGTNDPAELEDLDRQIALAVEYDQNLKDRGLSSPDGEATRNRELTILRARREDLSGKPLGGTVDVRKYDEVTPYPFPWTPPPVYNPTTFTGYMKGLKTSTWGYACGCGHREFNIDLAFFSSSCIKCGKVHHQPGVQP